MCFTNLQINNSDYLNYKLDQVNDEDLETDPKVSFRERLGYFLTNMQNLVKSEERFLPPYPTLEQLKGMARNPLAKRMCEDLEHIATDCRLDRFAFIKYEQSFDKFYGVKCVPPALDGPFLELDGKPEYENAVQGLRSCTDISESLIVKDPVLEALHYVGQGLHISFKPTREVVKTHLEIWGRWNYNKKARYLQKAMSPESTADAEFFKALGQKPPRDRGVKHAYVRMR